MARSTSSSERACAVGLSGEARSERSNALYLNLLADLARDLVLERGAVHYNAIRRCNDGECVALLG